MKTGRNDPCPCGSGKKYKKCCMSKDEKSHTEWKKQISIEISRHLLKHPCDIWWPEGGYGSKQEIINAYTSAGYVVDIEESDDDFDGEINHYLHVNLICPHGYSEHEEGFELVDGKWEGYESAEGDVCSVCQIIRDHKVVPACPSCNTLLPVLPESERLRYYKEGIDYLSNALCPKCRSGFLTQRLPWLPTA
jgi:hypothetical protein